MEGVEGKTPWRKGKTLCRKLSASQHTEDNGSVVWDSGVSGQNSVCSRPWVAWELRESVSCHAVAVWSVHWGGSPDRKHGLPRREGRRGRGKAQKLLLYPSPPTSTTHLASCLGPGMAGLPVLSKPCLQGHIHSLQDFVSVHTRSGSQWELWAAEEDAGGRGWLLLSSDFSSVEGAGFHGSCNK